MTPSSAALQTQLDRARARGLVSIVKTVAPPRGIDPAVMLGIASRESRMGDALAPDCTGDRGNAFGVFQIDGRFHPGFAARPDRCSDRAGAEKAAKLLQRNKRQLPTTRAAIAAYNAGVQSVQQALSGGRSPDAPTTGGDYSSDVLRRADAFRTALDLEEPSPTRTRTSFGGGAMAFALLGSSAFIFSQLLRKRYA